MYRVLVSRSEGKRQLGKPRHRWKEKIFKKWDMSVNWIDLAQDKNISHGSTTSFSTKWKEYLD